MNKKHPIIVMYDFDGVIFNSKGSELAAYRLMKNPGYEWNYEELNKLRPVDIIRRFEMSDSQRSFESGLNIYRIFADILPARFKRLLFLIKMGRTVRSTEYIAGDFFDGVVDTLKILNEKGIIQGICTNSEGNRLPYWLKKKGCTGYISAFTSRNDRREYGIKPDPRTLLNLMNKIKKKHNLGPIDRTRVYFLGDNPTDIWAAKNARIKSIAVLTGHATKEELEYLGANYVLESMNELISIPEIFSDDL